LLTSAVSIGNDGNLTASSTLVGNAAATNVGNTAAPNDAAAAYLTLDSAGITQTGGEDITIGDTGNVTANAFASGSGIAQSTNGNATADGNLDVTGLNLNNAGSLLTIGAAGNVSGLGVIGTLNSSGTLGNQVQITAATTDGIAIASGDFDATGILGNSGGATITAGPNDGDVRGQVLAGGNVLASSTGTSNADDATASIGTTALATRLSGIENIDIIGGQVGTNSVIGTSVGDFDATATSVKGDSTAFSNVDAFGILGNGSDTINLSGGISAIAQLSNTVTATSVSGNAIANATSDAVGLSGYNVTIIGSGTLNASATSNSQSLASSVGGRAGA
jgi:hypothetical protein